MQNHVHIICRLEMQMRETNLLLSRLQAQEILNSKFQVPPEMGIPIGEAMCVRVCVCVCLCVYVCFVTRVYVSPTLGAYPTFGRVSHSCCIWVRLVLR